MTNANFQYDLTRKQTAAIKTAISEARKGGKKLSVWFNEDGSLVGMIEVTKGCMVSTMSNIHAVTFNTCKAFEAEVEGGAWVQACR